MEVGASPPGQGRFPRPQKKHEMLEQDKPMTTEDLTKSRSPRALLIVLAVVVVGYGYQYFSQSEVQSLHTQSGIQWDTEMAGDWVRQSQPSQSGVEIYRIHITQGEQVFGPDRRSMKAGEKLAVSLHFRVAKAGKYQARVVLLDDEGVVKAEGEKSPIPVQQGQFSQFRGVVLLTEVPTDIPKTGVLRLEVNGLGTEASGFWEADFSNS